MLVLWCCLNDVLELAGLPDTPGLTPEEQVTRKVNIFRERLVSFHQTTSAHANHHQLPTPNRLSFSTVMRPPQLYDLPGTKGQTWRTHNSLVDGINKTIDQFNESIRTAHGEILGGLNTFPIVVGLSQHHHLTAHSLH